MVLSILLVILAIYIALFGILSVNILVFENFSEYCNITEKLKEIRRIIFPWVTAVTLSIIVVVLIAFALRALLTVIA